MRKRITAVLLFISIHVYSQTYQWQPVGGGIKCSSALSDYLGGCYVNCMVADTVNNLLYVGGPFDTIGNQYSSTIAYWDGSNWHSMSSPPTVPNSMIMYNGKLAIIGNYGVSLWDGSSWQPILGLNGKKDKGWCLTIYKGELIAGGQFYMKINSTDTASCIATWNGTAWHKLGKVGFGSSANPWVSSLEVYKGELYAGGGFVYADTLETRNIARWDGIEWKRVGGIGTNLSSGNFFGAPVISLRNIEGSLFAYGSFDSIGGIYASYFAKWNDTIWKRVQWNPIGAFLIPYKSSIIYIMGNSLFQTDDISTFIKLGTISGVLNGYIHYVTVYNNQIFIGGAFNTVNGVQALKIARLVDITSVTEPDKEMQIKLYPNPATAQLTVTGYHQQEATMEVKDLLGRTLQTQKLQPNSTVVNVASLASGVYLLQVRDKGGIQVQKFIKE